ncbi:MAG: hypothetical protein ACM3JE_03460 [Betaproteobacteria bacterium]
MGQVDKRHLDEHLKLMINEKQKNEPIEKLLTIFCHRHGVSMVECREMYDRLVKQGLIKEK